MSDYVLKHCPFCGESSGPGPVLEENLQRGRPAEGSTMLRGWHVRCAGCGVTTERIKDLDGAVRRWNTRRPPNA